MDAITIVWGVSLIIGVVVIGVVAILLGLIKNTAAKINVAAGEIWTQGKLTANNTIQIPLFLSTTNRVVAKIYDSAVNIVGGAKAIQQHAEGCPGCPNCILQHH
jgi:hypothetical protein